MTALIGETPTDQRELADNWRDRIEQELDKPGDNGIAECIYETLATLTDRPTYQTAWQAVTIKHNLKSDVIRQYYQTIFDLIWQTLCGTERRSKGNETGISMITGFPLAARAA